MSIGRLAVLVHGQARVANRIANREFLGMFGIAFVQRNESLAIVDAARFVEVKYPSAHLLAMSETLKMR